MALYRYVSYSYMCVCVRSISLLSHHSFWYGTYSVKQCSTLLNKKSKLILLWYSLIVRSQGKGSY